MIIQGEQDMQPQVTSLLFDVFLRHCLNLRTLSTHFNKERNGVAQGKELGDENILMHLFCLQ